MDCKCVLTKAKLESIKLFFLTPSTLMHILIDTHEHTHVHIYTAVGVRRAGVGDIPSSGSFPKYLAVIEFSPRYKHSNTGY